MRYFTFALLCCLLGCDDLKDKAALEMRQLSSKPFECTREDTRDGDVAFCSDGQQLVICTTDEGCIHITLAAERE
jgi:hypothetical protein